MDPTPFIIGFRVTFKRSGREESAVLQSYHSPCLAQNLEINHWRVEIRAGELQKLQKPTIGRGATIQYSREDIKIVNIIVTNIIAIISIILFIAQGEIKISRQKLPF